MTKSLPSFPSVKILSSSGPIRGQNSFFPLCAAILQIAACYDYMTSILAEASGARPYSGAFYFFRIQ